MSAYRVAFLPLLRTTFDVELAHQTIAQARLQLQAAGLELFEPQEPITDLAQAERFSTQLRAEAVDLLLVYQATFADSTMVTALTENAQAPVFLWAVPEDWTGGRLRLNSLCGINLAGHALTLRHRNYDYAYAAPDDPDVVLQIRALAAAGALRRKLQATRLGVVGEHPAGFDSCRLDDENLQAVFGLQIRRIPLQEVFDRARGISEENLAQTRAALDTRLDNLASLEQAPLKGTLAVYHALKQIAEEEKLDGLAVRCWPEFFTQLGSAACGAMSLLSDGFGGENPLPCSCEADINGTVTQLILQTLSQAPAFGTDMVGVNTQTDRVALWHCGLAPLSMADPASQPHGTIHSNRKLPLLMDFPLKRGQVTLARVSQASGQLRLVYGRGQMVSEPKPFSGTAGVLQLDVHARAFLDLLMREGLEHHISLTYGDYVRELQAFADLIGLPTLKMQPKEVKEPQIA